MARTIEDGGLFRPGAFVPTADGGGSVEFVPGTASRTPGPILTLDPGPALPPGTAPNPGPGEWTPDGIIPSMPIPGLFPPPPTTAGTQPGAPEGSTGTGTAPVTNAQNGPGAGGRASGTGSVSDVGGGESSVTAADPKDAMLGAAIVAAAVAFVWWRSTRKGK